VLMTGSDVVRLRGIGVYDWLGHACSACLTDRQDRQGKDRTGTAWGQGGDGPD
jgi:hypothetical protein